MAHTTNFGNFLNGNLFALTDINTNPAIRSYYYVRYFHPGLYTPRLSTELMQSSDIRYACTGYCQQYSGSDRFACYAGCACDSNLDLNGNSISSCSDYCVESRFTPDNAYTTYSALFDSKFFKYMEWFSQIGSAPMGGLIRAKIYWTTRNYDSALPYFYFSYNFQPNPCLDGCAQRGICDEFTEPTQAPPTSEPTDSTLVESTNEPTDSPSSPANEPTAPTNSTNEPTDSVFYFNFAMSLDSINAITVFICSIAIMMSVDLVSQ